MGSETGNSPIPNPQPLTPATREFYLRPTVDVARDLLGRYLVLERPDEPARIGRIVETEAYLGEHDLACHSARGRTARTAPMFEEGGHAYVYLVYGMYWCLNVVTEEVGHPCAVLLRAVEPIAGLNGSSDGPGKLCRAFGLDGSWNRADLVASPLHITCGQPIEAATIGVSPRIGVAYAGPWAAEPLRFYDATSPYVSRREKAVSRRQ